MLWKDKWLSGVTLLEKYPRLYAKSLSKNATIREMGFCNNGSWEWKLEWRREWFEWEKSHIDIFMNELGKRTIVISRECVMCGRGEETIQHLFFNCTLVEKIWNMSDKWTELSQHIII